MKFSRFPAGLLIAASFLALPGCMDTPITKKIAGPAYESLTPYKLDVMEVIVVNDSRPDSTTQKLAQEFDASPEAALREWAAKRLQTVGSQGSLSYVIKEANITSRTLPTAGGINGYFSNDQAEELRGVMSVLMSVDSGDGRSKAEINVSVNATHTLSEKATPAEREKIYQNLLAILMDKFNSEAELQIGNYFARYLR